MAPNKKQQWGWADSLKQAASIHAMPQEWTTHASMEGYNPWPANLTEPKYPMPNLVPFPSPMKTQVEAHLATTYLSLGAQQRAQPAAFAYVRETDANCQARYASYASAQQGAVQVHDFWMGDALTLETPRTPFKPAQEAGTLKLNSARGCESPVGPFDRMCQSPSQTSEDYEPMEAGEWEGATSTQLQLFPTMQMPMYVSNSQDQLRLSLSPEY